MARIKAALAAVVKFLRREPVAVWGVVVAAILGVLPALGVPARDVTWVGFAAAAVGIPVVRGKVTPWDAVKALVDGAKRKAPIGPKPVKAVKKVPAKPDTPPPPTSAA